MTPPGPDGRSRELRRLPKRPVGPVPDSARATREPRGVEEHLVTFRSGRDLYFEALPDPFPENSGDDLISLHGTSGPPETSVASVEDEPSLYFRHSSPARPMEETPAASSWEDALPLRTATPRSPVGPPSPLLPQVNEEVTGQRLEERAKRPSGQMPTAFRDSEGDPKPASTRPASTSRTRSARASGQFLAARTSGVVPAAQASGEYSVARASGEVQVAALVTQREEIPERWASAPSEDDAPTLKNVDERDAPSSSGRSGKGMAVAGMALASIALVAYAFQIGPLESAADAEAGRLAAGWFIPSSLLPWLLVVPAVLLFGLIVWLLAGIIGLRRPQKKQRRPVRDKQPKTPLNQFKDAALRQGVDNRTAYRGWRLLESACTLDRVITIDASLADDLALAPREVRAVHLQLLTDLSRTSDPAMRLPPAETVLDLLKAVDAAPMARPAANSGEVAIPGDPGQRKRKGAASS